MADPEHVPDPGALGWPSHGGHHHLSSSLLFLRRPCCLVWFDVAHWVYRAEPLHMGLPSELHPPFTTDLAELHLERYSMYG